MHSAIFCILFPCASGNVSPNNGFNCVLTYVILEYDDTEMKKNLKKILESGKESLTWENLESTDLHTAVL